MAIFIELVLIIAVLVSLVLSRNLTDSRLQSIVGEWDCARSLVEDSETYTGYLHLSIGAAGSFSIYDREAGNPCIEGFLIRTDGGELTLICTNLDGFDPPPGWEYMDIIEDVDFRVVESTLYLSCEDDDVPATLEFYRSEK